LTTFGGVALFVTAANGAVLTFGCYTFLAVATDGDVGGKLVRRGCAWSADVIVSHGIVCFGVVCFSVSQEASTFVLES
jgi:hypothetical protein